MEPTCIAVDVESDGFAERLARATQLAVKQGGVMFIIDSLPPIVSDTGAGRRLTVAKLLAAMAQASTSVVAQASTVNLEGRMPAPEPLNRPYYRRFEKKAKRK